MRRQDRLKVYEKYYGHCAYCGDEITIKQMQVDHLIPIWRDVPDLSLERMNVIRGEDNFSNWMPSCRYCNNYKHSHDLETFRSELFMQLERANKTSSNYRMAKRYKQVIETPKIIIFYFELK